MLLVGLLSSAFAVASLGSSSSSSFSVRLAARSDILPVGILIERAFAFNRFENGANDDDDNDAAVARTYSTSRDRSWVESWITCARIALDVERRMTPWDWCRHAQLVAEDSESGAILGFAEVWAEDAESLANASAVTPQPVLFNLCVSEVARRRGVARELVRQCEDRCRSWGEEELFLKVRADNDAACELYVTSGYEILETRPVAELSAWQDRWKGGAAPLRVLKKRLAGAMGGATAGASDRAAAAIRPKGADEFEVTLDDVLAYKDRDALIWFGLLLARNAEFLAPSYRIFPAAAAFLGWFTYYWIIKIVSGNFDAAGVESVVREAADALSL